MKRQTDKGLLREKHHQGLVIKRDRKAGRRVDSLTPETVSEEETVKDILFTNANHVSVARLLSGSWQESP